VWQGSDFDAFYTDLFDEAWQEQDDAAWTVEYAGGPYSCNPCTGVYLDGQQATALGFPSDGSDDFFLTRLHMRYTPEQADEELMLYASNIPDTMEASYADDVADNYDCIETFCDGSPTPGNEGGGCAVVGTPGVAAALAGLVALRRRR
jgi:hypothetical protein